jgi:hypothetical protein
MKKLFFSIAFILACIFMAPLAKAGGWFFVQNSNTFSPLSLTNLAFAVIADCNNGGSGCFSLTGTDVNSVTDLSSNAYVFDGTAGGTKPIRATNQINGQPAITFTTGAYLKNATNFLTASSIDFTFHIAFKRGSQSFPYLGEIGGNGSNGIDFYLSNGSPWLIFSGTNWATYGAAHTTANFSADTWYAIALTHTAGGTYQFYQYSSGVANTITTATGTDSGGNAATATYLGNFTSGNFPIGAFEEFDMQTSVATPTELSNMAGYFQTKLGL